jgi:DNA-binding LacI/PurR family transcriptional regulator
MITIKEVARIAGVSPSTVSGILNKNICVKHATHERVMQAIQQTGYRPSAIARSMRTKETKTLGLLIASITNSYMPQIARGVEDYAYSKGYHIFLCDTDRKMEKQKMYIQSLIDQNIDGMIFMNTEPDLADIAMIVEKGIAVVNTEPTQHNQVDEVLVDYAIVAKQMTEYLISLGHKRIALIDGPLTASRSRERLNGFIGAHQEHGVPLDLSLVKRGNYSPEFGYRLANELFSMKTPPTCILTSDYTALGVLSAAFDKRIAIPGDLSVAGYSKSSSFLRPMLTTVDHSNFKMGEIMAKLVINRKRNAHLKKRAVTVESKIIIGESTGPPP